MSINVCVLETRLDPYELWCSPLSNYSYQYELSDPYYGYLVFRIIITNPNNIPNLELDMDATLASSATQIWYCVGTAYGGAIGGGFVAGYDVPSFSTNMILPDSSSYIEFEAVMIGTGSTIIDDLIIDINLTNQGNSVDSFNRALPFAPGDLR